VSPIPDPPEPPRPKTISVRLSEDEYRDLERVQTLLGKHWKRKTEKAEAVRAALSVLLTELEKEVGGEKTKATRK